ncbi:MAG TPA: hypothetical protein VMV24_02160, partial [Candidatus Dormibacteraeota bacterium]|nr:hypothetical protein [Candidatus Dormibacteraeota bacterium]
LVDFRQKCNLLARSRYEEYGFRSFNESCAFVGAYVMAALSDNYNERISGDIPSFTYEDNGVYHKISIGGTIHGDFKISEIKTLTSGIISPIGTETEFSPIGDMNLSAYHSVEPSIVESMLAHEFLKGDKQRLTRLIDEFMDICRPLVDHDGNVKYTVGNFGDYGQSSSISDYPISIKILLEDRKLRNEDILFGSFVDPAGSSDILFEIISLDNGIRLQNRYSNYSDTESYIDINRQHFGEIFNALLSQTQAGLGRTSPHQLIKLIIEVKKMLDE